MWRRQRNPWQRRFLISNNMGLIYVSTRKTEARSGGFFVQEIAKHMDVELLSNGEYFGNLQIGNYVELVGGSSVENLKMYALRRIRNKLQRMIVEIEEGN